MARVEARGELTAHGTKQDATIEYCIHRKDDTREREGERGRRRAQKRESKRVESRRDESTRSEAVKAGGQRVRARERERERRQRRVVARGGDYRAVNHPR